MKKFFSILCALAIVMSASAVPARTLGKDLKVDVKELKSAPVKTVKMVNSLQKAERAAVAFKAPQAKKETYNLTAEECTERFYTSGNDVWVKLFVGEEYQFFFDVVVAEGTQELALNQTYTLTDMLASYTYAKDAEGNKIVFAAATLTKSTTVYSDENGDQTLVHFLASATDTAGNVYNVAYDQAPFIISGDTTEIVFTEPMKKPVFAQGLCQLRATTDDNDAAFTFTTATEGSAAGTYGEDDMNLEYTFVNGMEAISAHCVVTETANGHIDLEGWILASDGDVYHVTMFFDVPTAQSQVGILASNLELDDTYASWLGVIIAEASNQDYSVSMYLPADNYLGTFAAEDVDLTIEGADGEIELYEGSVTVSLTDNGGVSIMGSALGMNNVEYTLVLCYVAPEPTSQETLNGAGYLYLEEYSGTNYWNAVAMNQEGSRYISLLAFVDGNDAGTYAKADLYASYTYAGKFVGADTTWYDMVDANITLAINGEVATVTGTFLGKSEVDDADITEFTLNLTLQVVDERGGGSGDQYDAQDEDFKYVFSSYDVDDQYLAQYNVLVVEATDAENHIVSIEFNVAAGTTALPAGVYEIAETGAAGTVSAGSVEDYIYGSFAGVQTTQGIQVPMWLFNEGTVTVNANGVIEVIATNTWGRAIECRLGEWPQGIENAEAEVNAVKVVRNGQLVIIKNGVEFNAQGAVVK